MSKNSKQNFRGESEAELRKLLADNKQKLRELMFDLHAGKVKNVKEIRQVRVTIARILTVMNDKAATQK